MSECDCEAPINEEGLTHYELLRHGEESRTIMFNANDNAVFLLL